MNSKSTAECLLTILQLNIIPHPTEKRNEKTPRNQKLRCPLVVGHILGYG